MKFFNFYLILFVSLFLLLGCEKNEDSIVDKNEPYDKVVTAITTHNDVVWVGTLNNGIYKLDDEVWSNFTVANGLLSNYINVLLIDQNGHLWGGTNEGVMKLENEMWTNYTTDDGLFNNDIRSLACDTENNIWIGTRNNRLVKFDGEDFTAYHVNPEASTEAEMGHIHSVACDFDGNIWVGSCISGLSMFDGENWSDYINNLNVFVQASVISMNGDIWIGHLSGAYKYADNVWTHFNEEDGLANYCILSMDVDMNDNIWVGTKQGISKFDGTTWTNYMTADSIYVGSLACCNTGDIWVASSDGLVRFNPN